MSLHTAEALKRRAMFVASAMDRESGRKCGREIANEITGFRNPYPIRVGFRTEVFPGPSKEFDNALWNYLAREENFSPNISEAYETAKFVIRADIVEGVKNEPDMEGDHTFPGRINAP
jgi:hypothetical protein